MVLLEVLMPDRISPITACSVHALMSFGKISLVSLEHFALITFHSFHKVLSSSGQ